MNLKSIQQLLETEMDRKEFLVYLGAVVLAVTGVSSLAKTFLAPMKQNDTQAHTKASFGSNPYGG